MTAIPPLVEVIPQEPNEKIAESLASKRAEEITKKEPGEPATIPTLSFQTDGKPIATPEVFRRTHKYWVIIAAIFFFFFMLGLNGGGTGPLLPRYQEFYQVSGNPSCL